MSLARQLNDERKARLQRFADAAIRREARQTVIEPPAPVEAEPEDIKPVCREPFFYVVSVSCENDDTVKVRRPAVRLIQRKVCEFFQVDLGDMLSARRTAEIVRPRQVAMYLAKDMTPLSLPEIGRRFGGRDHTTILHGIRKVDRLMQSDLVLVATIAELRQAIKAEVEAQEDLF